MRFTNTRRNRLGEAVSMAGVGCVDGTDGAGARPTLKHRAERFHRSEARLGSLARRERAGVRGRLPKAS